ncbi:hypothetical protein D3C71_1887460 [compost metagenome]
MDYVAGLIDAVVVIRVEQNLAFDVYRDQRRGRDLFVHVPERVDQQLPLFSGDAGRDVVVDQVAHAKQRHQAICRRQVDARFPFGFRYGGPGLRGAFTKHDWSSCPRASRV